MSQWPIIDNDTTHWHVLILVLSIALFAGEPDLVDSIGSWFRNQPQQCVEMKNEG